MKREIKLANPRGFCAGVDRAIEIVNQALLKFGPPVYVRHEVVHNRNVVEDLKSKGAIFVEQIDEIPEGAITVRRLPNLLWLLKQLYLWMIQNRL